MQDKKDELLERLYRCCLNATGAYQALQHTYHAYPGYDGCKQRLEDTIAAYEAYRKENPTEIWRNNG